MTPAVKTYNNNPLINQDRGAIAMSKSWGKIVYNRQQGAWAVKGTWQGKRLYYSEYKSEIGYKTCQTQQEAMMLQVVISSEIENGMFNPNRYRKSKPLHIAKLAQKWPNETKPNIRESTHRNNYRCAVKHIINGLGHIFIGDLNYTHILKWVNELPLKLSSKKVYHGVLRDILKYAKKAGYISQMPDLVEFKHGLKVPVKQPDWLDQDAFDKVLDKMDPHDRYIFRFLRLTGCRVGEARALQKSDLYPAREYIMIRHTFSRAKDGEILATVKQKRERRIPFYADVYELFEEMPNNLTPFVFVTRKARPYNSSTQRDCWNPASREALGYVFPLNNAGRHSFANQLLRQGVSPDIVSSLLGHSDKKLLLRHYGDQWEMTGSAKRVVDNLRKI